MSARGQCAQVAVSTNWQCIGGGVTQVAAYKWKCTGGSVSQGAVYRWQSQPRGSVPVAVSAKGQ